MYSYYICLLLLFRAATSSDCVTENFENGFGSLTSHTGLCAHDLSPGPIWSLGQYSSLNITSPHPASKSFIRLRTSHTCISTPRFTITEGGSLEIKGYGTLRNDSRLIANVHRHNPDGADVRVGSWWIWDPKSASGWQTFSVHVPGPGSYDGYISFSGFAADSSHILLIDSFRYVAPSFNKDLCMIYGDSLASTTITEAITTKTTITTEVPNTKTTPLPELNTEHPTNSASESPTSATTVTEPSKTPRVFAKFALNKSLHINATFIKY